MCRVDTHRDHVAASVAALTVALVASIVSAMRASAVRSAAFESVVERRHLIAEPFAVSAAAKSICHPMNVSVVAVEAAVWVSSVV